MSALSIQVPFPVFQDRDGQPLDNGYVWLGTSSLNPQTNPIACYYDAALTIAATQPLRTINGFISRSGSPTQVYVDAVNFSILVQDSKGTTVFSVPEGTGISPNASGVVYDPAGTGAVATTVQAKFRQYPSTDDKGASASATASFNTTAIQQAVDDLVAAGGGTLLINKTTTFYPVNDSITVGDNVRIVFEGQIKLTAASSIGTVFYLDGDNIEIINPLIDGGGSASSAGENGISIVSGNNIQIRGGKIQNCNRGGTGMMFGGKGVQIEAGGVEGVLVDGTEFSYCFMAMSTIRDGLTIPSDYGIQFTNIKADNCDILFFVKQSNINNTNGLEHTVQLNNFYAVQCGAFEGVMQFSRAANVQVSNGVVINDPGSVTNPLIRGNHRFCKFDNIRFSGDCTRIIDLDPGTFAVDSSYACENNTYDINYSGTAGYVAYASLATTNRILVDSKIVVNMDSDVSTKLVGDELRNGYCELFITQGGRTVITTTATFYLEGRSTMALYPAGISMPRFNASQVTFPSTQIASTDVNTLDDYRENPAASPWTPVDSSAAALSLTTAYGDYIKIGRMVFASFRVTYPATASGANTLIGGLPFASANNSGRIVFGLALRYTDQGALMTGANNPGATTFSLAFASGTLVTNANMSGKTLDGVLIYMAAA